MDVALILGSAVWDILEPTNNNETQNDKDFADHLQACRQLIVRDRSQYPNNGVSLFWKSLTAFHVHLLPERCYENQKCIDRTRYMSTTLIKDLHVRQKQLMEEELGVPFLDLFEATYLSASWSMPGDGRHYQYRLNQRLNNYYF